VAQLDRSCPLLLQESAKGSLSTVLTYLIGEGVETMSNIAFPNSSASMALRLVMAGTAVAAAVIIASAVPTVTDLGTAKASADPGAGNQHGGPNYLSITGTRVGARLHGSREPARRVARCSRQPKRRSS
jgi:hypothetical protein